MFALFFEHPTTNLIFWILRGLFLLFNLLLDRGGFSLLGALIFYLGLFLLLFFCWWQDFELTFIWRPFELLVSKYLNIERFDLLTAVLSVVDYGPVAL